MMDVLKDLGLLERNNNKNSKEDLNEDTDVLDNNSNQDNKKNDKEIKSDIEIDSTSTDTQQAISPRP